MTHGVSTLNYNSLHYFQDGLKNVPWCRFMPLELLVGSKDPKSTFEYVTNASIDFTQRVTNLWLLNFNACSDLIINQSDVEKACKTCLETGPFCPRPVSQPVTCFS